MATNSITEFEVIEPGSLALPELEALEASRAVAENWGLNDRIVCPSVAAIFLEGASSGGPGRNPLAHMVATEAYKKHDLSTEEVERILRDLNTRFFPPLPTNEILRIVSRLELPSTRPYSCEHPLKSTYCIGGDVCPIWTNKGRWKNHRVSPNGFTVSGWTGVLHPRLQALWLGCYRLARLKGRGPNQSIPFTFRELEKVSCVDRHYHRVGLTELRQDGLLADIELATARSGRGSHSSFKFPPILPTVSPYLRDGDGSDG